MSATVTVLLISAGILLGLVGAVLGRKAVRDLAELRSGTVREELRAALVTGEGEMFGQVAMGRPARQADLLAVLRETEHAQRARLGRELDASPEGPALRAALERRLHARQAPRRGMAALVVAALELPYATNVAALANDPDSDVRLTACAALASIGTDAAAEELIALLRRDTLPPARIIERLAAPWAVPALLRALARESDAALRPLLLRAIGLAHVPDAATDVATCLADTDLEVRIGAARALGELRAADCAPALRRALADPDWEVRAQAAKALGRVGSFAAVPDLAAAMGDRAWWVRTNAGDALCALDGPGRVWLRKVAAGPDRYASERALAALREAGDAA